MALERYISERKKDKDILIMTHQILGYPSFEINEKAIEIFAENGIDMVELQIPFSDPVADGPIFSNANQAAVSNGVKVEECLKFVARMVKKHDVSFLIMTYYNIIFKYGIEAFTSKCREIGVKGLIVPDAPVDDAEDFFISCREHGVDAIGLATPYTNENRLKDISQACSGFIYYVPRKGVTGSRTTFDEEVVDRIRYVKSITKKNIAVGFGIQERADIERLCGVSDIAILGSRILKLIEQDGIDKLEEFIKSIANIKV